MSTPSRSENSINETIIRLDQLIRDGLGNQVRIELSELKMSEVPRNRAADLANIARRANLSSWGLKLMRPILRPETPLSQPPTTREAAIYAALLIKLGALQEAIEILSQQDQRDADVLLYSAFAQVSQWNYTLAIPLLEEYCRHPAINPYQKCVAQVNLAAAYVFIEDQEATEKLLAEIRQITQNNKWNLLFENALELSAQAAITAKRWKEADQFLKKAEARSPSSSHHYHLFTHKWRAILNLIRTNGSSESLNTLITVRRQATERGHWETLRDCDYFLALQTKNFPLFNHVYFGTRYQGYRERMKKAFGNKFQPTDSYIWQPEGIKAKRIFDLELAVESDGYVQLKAGQTLHRMLKALASDFYRPLPIGSLFSLIFPGEYFNPFSAPKRISLALQRLRSWAEKNAVPISIEVNQEQYQLHLNGPYGLLVKERSSPSEPKSHPEKISLPIQLDRLKSKFSDRSFTSADAAHALSISPRSANTLLKWAVENSGLRRQGNGRATRYIFK